MSEIQVIQRALEKTAWRCRWQRGWRLCWRGLFAAAALWLLVVAVYKLVPLPEMSMNAPGRLFTIEIGVAWAAAMPSAAATSAKYRFILSSSKEMWTPAGLRTLSRDDPRYRGVYRGDQAARDSAYHQGTAWPWLSGPFIEAWVRTRGGTSEAKREARERFFSGFERRMNDYGIGHLEEIADGDAPHLPNGCPFQAWSLGELLRLERTVLA